MSEFDARFSRVADPEVANEGRHFRKPYVPPTELELAERQLRAFSMAMVYLFGSYEVCGVTRAYHEGFRHARACLQIAEMVKP